MELYHKWRKSTNPLCSVRTRKNSHSFRGISTYRTRKMGRKIHKLDYHLLPDVTHVMCNSTIFHTTSRTYTTSQLLHTNINAVMSIAPPTITHLFHKGTSPIIDIEEFLLPDWEECIKMFKARLPQTASREVLKVEGIISLHPHWNTTDSRRVWDCKKSHHAHTAWNVVSRQMHKRDIPSRTKVVSSHQRRQYEEHSKK